jgi:hypothetical protein
MHILRKHVAHLGFKGISPFDSSFQSVWYKVIPEKNVVIGISNTIPRGVFRFDLTPQQMKAFQNGKLSLTPPGHCHVTGGPNVEDCSWVFQGEFERIKELYEILKLTRVFPAGTLKPLPRKKPNACIAA